nr:hypothetical protein [Tanacetum cinerariifolium]
MLNRDSSIIPSSSKIDSLLDKFAGELTLLKSISPGVDKTDCHPKNEIRFSERLLYDNSSPRPPEEFNFENSDAEIESFSPSPIPNKDGDSFMEEIDLFLNPDDPMPLSIEDDDNDSEGDILFLERLLHDDPIPLLDTLDFSYEVRTFLPFFTYPVTSPVFLSFGSEDKIFDPGITINHFYSFQPGSSHRHRAFKKFNTHRIKDDDYDSEGDILILEELLSNDSISLPENESFHFDTPSSPRPPAKPPDDDDIEPNLGILTVKVVVIFLNIMFLCLDFFPPNPPLLQIWRNLLISYLIEALKLFSFLLKAR